MTPGKVPSSFAFSFRIRLPASADRAYGWATDYRPDDPKLMGEDGRRTVERLTPDTILLTDTVRSDGRTMRRQRLVRLRPKERSWTNTHLAGTRLHSQFLYRIVPVGRNASRLEFTGLQVEYGPRTLTAAQRAGRAKEVRTADRQTWVRLVRAMRKDLVPKR